MLQSNLPALSDAALLISVQNVVRGEREMSVGIIHHLLEIDNRRLWAEGYPSLFEYCVKEFKYGESQTYRCLAAVRMLRELPDIESALIEGDLTITNLSKVGTFFRKQEKFKGKKLTTSEKRALLHQLKNRSENEVSQVLAEMSPDAFFQDQVKFVGGSRIQLRTTLPLETFEKLVRIRDFLGNIAAGQAGYAQQIDKMCDITLLNLDPLEKMKRRQAKASNVHPKDLQKTSEDPTAPEREQKPASKSESESESISDCANGPKTNEQIEKRARKPIPERIREEVWQRDNGQCAHVHPKTNERCPSTFGLQIDHIVPIAIGGSNQSSNLRLLCRTHNQLHGEKVFGQKKMNEHKEVKLTQGFASGGI